jgi:uncharacterized protein
MSENLSEPYRLLASWVGQWSSAITAYSGGVDSAVVAVVAHRVLGRRALACIGISPSYPERERREAIDLAEREGLSYRLVETGEQRDPRYLANPEDRCFFCKAHLFAELTAIARTEDWDVVLDGSQADDLRETRHGARAGSELQVRSPLAELGIGKVGVRALARELGLPVWNKPAMACLASRVPHGTPVTPEILSQVERAEDALASLGFAQFRVRHHGDTARIEVPAAAFADVVRARADIVAALRGAGYRYVTLDLAGLRGGAGDDSIFPLVVTHDARR